MRAKPSHPRRVFMQQRRLLAQGGPATSLGHGSPTCCTDLVLDALEQALYDPSLKGTELVHYSDCGMPDLSMRYPE